MAFMTEAEYFAARAITCRIAGRAATDRAVAMAHDELARRYDILSRGGTLSLAGPGTAF